MKYFLPLFLALLLFSQPAFSDSAYTAIDLDHLAGVDTLAVTVDRGPDYSLTSKQFNASDPSLHDVATKTLRDMLSKQTWLTISPLANWVKAGEEFRKPNILVIRFLVSAKPDTVEGKQVVAASLSMKMEYILPDKSSSDVRITTPVSYPFVAPADPQKFADKVAEGVHYLTSYLPGYLNCVHAAVTKEGECNKQDMFFSWSEK